MKLPDLSKIKCSIIIDNDKILGEKVQQKLFKLNFSWNGSRRNELLTCSAYSYELNFYGIDKNIISYSSNDYTINEEKRRNPNYLVLDGKDFLKGKTSKIRVPKWKGIWRD